MSDWNTLQWIGALAGIATVVGTIFAVSAFFRRHRSPTSHASAAGKKSPTVQTTGSKKSPVVTNSPGAVVIGGDLNLRPGYDIEEHERIVDERVAQVRSDLERAHEAEIDAVRARIDALIGPEWDRDVLNAVDDALNTKRYDRAGELMAEMEEAHLMDATAKLVLVRQLRATIALVGGDAKTASEHIEVAVDVLAPHDPVSAMEFRNDAAMNFQDYGERIGGDGIVEAIEMYRRNLEQLNREALPEPWVETQHNLGNALLLHGMRAGDLRTLDTAIEAFQAALQVCNRTTDPENWSQTQISLGGALLAFGLRCGGQQGKDYLAESVSVLRAAGDILTPEVDPGCWAGIQSNLGAALSQQGVWSGGVEGIRLLGEAVEVYRGILEIRTRETDPSEWAGTQANLSYSLAQQATLMSDHDAFGLFSEAIPAARAALQVYSKQQYPLDWARTLNNLGAILNEQAHLQEGEAGLECVEAAMDAFQCALEVYTREELATQWAGVQRNRSAALLREAVLKDPPDHLDALSRAVSVCRGALEVFTRELHPADWAAMQFNLGAALLHLGAWTGGAEGLATLEEASCALESVQAVWVRESHPDRWADMHRCLGHVYESKGDIDPKLEVENYRRALREADHALEVSPHEQRPDRFQNARAMRDRVAEKLSAAGG